MLGDTAFEKRDPGSSVDRGGEHVVGQVLGEEGHVGLHDDIHAHRDACRGGEGGREGGTEGWRVSG